MTCRSIAPCLATGSHALSLEVLCEWLVNVAAPCEDHLPRGCALVVAELDRRLAGF